MSSSVVALSQSSESSDVEVLSLLGSICGIQIERSIFKLDVPKVEFTTIRRIAGIIQIFFKKNNCEFLNMKLIGGKVLNWIGRSCGRNFPSVDYDLHVTIDDDHIDVIEQIILTHIRSDNTIIMNGMVFTVEGFSLNLEKDIFLLKLKTEINSIEYHIDVSCPEINLRDFGVNAISINLTLDKDHHIICNRYQFLELVSLITGEAQECLFMRNILLANLNSQDKRDRFVRGVYRLYKMIKKFPIYNCGEYAGNDDGCPICRLTSDDWNSMTLDSQILHKMHLRFDCTHTICFMCYAKMRTRDRGRISCPLCRSELRTTEHSSNNGIFNSGIDEKFWGIVNECLPSFQWILKNEMIEPLVIKEVDDEKIDYSQSRASLRGLKNVLDSELGRIEEKNSGSQRSNNYRHTPIPLFCPFS
jgi:hypothetical protein